MGDNTEFLRLSSMIHDRLYPPVDMDCELCGERAPCKPWEISEQNLMLCEGCRADVHKSMLRDRMREIQDEEPKSRWQRFKDSFQDAYPKSGPYGSIIRRG